MEAVSCVFSLNISTLCSLSVQVESVGDAFLVISDVSCKSKSQAARNMADCALAYLILNRKEFPSLKVT